ncbi:hypothetical protein TRVL_04437 [Trypanosoma vivax]|nr:hypothetical protein TRVL_04437 [Trypanosoma vivax]
MFPNAPCLSFCVPCFGPSPRCSFSFRRRFAFSLFLPAFSCCVSSLPSRFLRPLCLAVLVVPCRPVILRFPLLLLHVLQVRVARHVPLAAAALAFTPLVRRAFPSALVPALRFSSIRASPNGPAPLPPPAFLLSCHSAPAPPIVPALSVLVTHAVAFFHLRRLVVHALFLLFLKSLPALPFPVATMRAASSPSPSLLPHPLSVPTVLTVNTFPLVATPPASPGPSCFALPFLFHVSLILFSLRAPVPRPRLHPFSFSSATFVVSAFPCGSCSSPLRSTLCTLWFSRVPPRPRRLTSLRRTLCCSVPLRYRPQSSTYPCRSQHASSSCASACVRLAPVPCVPRPCLSPSVSSMLLRQSFRRCCARFPRAPSLPPPFHVSSKLLSYVPLSAPFSFLPLHLQGHVGPSHPSFKKVPKVLSHRVALSSLLQSALFRGARRCHASPMPLTKCFIRSPRSSDRIASRPTFSSVRCAHAGLRRTFFFCCASPFCLVQCRYPDTRFISIPLKNFLRFFFSPEFRTAASRLPLRSCSLTSSLRSRPQRLSLYPL